MILKRPFGRTGHDSTRAVFGAASLGKLTQAEADKTLELLLQYGINHIDTAASYGDSELRIAPWLKRYPKTFFLATKTGERTYTNARDEIHRSLERLGVDHVDSLQLHNLVDPEEWKTAMGNGGALKAAVEAREQGLVRFIGVTGHGLTIAAMHLKSLGVFDFDSVLLPYSYILMQNKQYAADFEKLVELCEERKVAVQVIKTITRRPWGDLPQTKNTWYEPLEGQSDIDKMVHWAMAREKFFLCTVGDVTVLPKMLEATSHFKNKPTDKEMEAVLKQQTMEPLFVA
mgnify:FL=1